VYGVACAVIGLVGFGWLLLDLPGPSNAILLARALIPGSRHGRITAASPSYDAGQPALCFIGAFLGTVVGILPGSVRSTIAILLPIRSRLT
jgi:threonine/homoserine/homoserine lactone efflux protein